MTPTVYMRPRPQFSVSAGFIAIVSHVYHLETICHAIPLITFNNFTFTLLIGKKFGNGCVQARLYAYGAGMTIGSTVMLTYLC